MDSSVIDISGPENSDSDWGKHSSPSQRTQTVPTHKQQDSVYGLNLDFNSTYCSIKEVADDRAEYYDDLLEKFRIDGPTLANRRKTTKTIILKQEQELNSKMSSQKIARRLVVLGI